MSKNDISLKDAKVLMVDDMPANIDVLRKALINEGYQLFFANSGEKAIKIANRALPDLILLDVMMPGMDGYETCRRLKQTKATQNIPIIFLTAKNQPEDSKEGFELGAVDYIYKPFRHDEVCMRARIHVKTCVLMKQRERLFKDLRNSEERFRLLAHASPIGIFQLNIQGQIVYTNREWQDIFNLSETDNINEAWLQTIYVEDRETVQTALENSVRNQKDFSCKFRTQTSSHNDIRWIHTHITPLRYEGSQIEGFVGTVEDISEFKQAEEQTTRAKSAAEQARIAAEQAQRIAEQARIAADSANRAKSTFLAKMSHELRTPLNAIIGYSDMLGEEAEDSGYESILPDLYKIQTAGKNLLAIVSDILDLSKIEADKMVLTPTEFVTTKLIENVVTTIEPLIKQQNNNFVVKNIDELGTMHTDYQKVTQILLNILNNAAKCTRQGTITFTITRRQINRNGLISSDWLYFHITDTGSGIAPEHIEPIFNAFIQTDDSYTRAHDGTGLGLTICDHLSRAIGGYIYVSSEVGVGSTFTFQLPTQIPEQSNQIGVPLH
jgi:PAS domain S-box-containing protein